MSASGIDYRALAEKLEHGRAPTWGAHGVGGSGPRGQGRPHWFGHPAASTRHPGASKPIPPPSWWFGVARSGAKVEDAENVRHGMAGERHHGGGVSLNVPAWDPNPSGRLANCPRQRRTDDIRGDASR